MTKIPIFLTYVRCLVLFDYNFTEFLFQSKQQNLMGYFYLWDICILFVLMFVVPVFANMKQKLNVRINLVIKMTVHVTTKFVVTAVLSKLVITAVMMRLVLTTVKTSLVVTATSTKLVESVYFYESCHSKLGWEQFRKNFSPNPTVHQDENSKVIFDSIDS